MRKQKMRINFLLDNSHFKSDLEKIVHEKAKEVIIKKIRSNLTQSELDKVSIIVSGNIRNKFSFKIDGDEKIAEKIKNIIGQI